jgi:hypothetical protein
MSIPLSLPSIALLWVSAGLLIYIVTFWSAIRLARGRLDSSLVDLGFERQGSHIRIYKRTRVLFWIVFYILVGPFVAISQVGTTISHPNRG